MSIAAVNAVYSGQGPSKTGQIFEQGEMSGSAGKMLPFSATATLDGSATTFAVNYIDGTQTIPSPVGVIACSTGGTAAGTIAVSSAVTHNASTGQDDFVTITISGAGSNGNTLKVAGFILFP